MGFKKARVGDCRVVPADEKGKADVYVMGRDGWIHQKVPNGKTHIRAAKMAMLKKLDKQGA